jgi:hypothetical protein
MTNEQVTAFVLNDLRNSRAKLVELLDAMPDRGYVVGWDDGLFFAGEGHTMACGLPAAQVYDVKVFINVTRKGQGRARTMHMLDAKELALASIDRTIAEVAGE